MPDYKKMYLTMAGAAEDVVCLLEKSEPTANDWPLFMNITKRLTDAPSLLVRRGRCPHRPAAPSGAALPQEGVSKEGGRTDRKPSERKIV